MNILSLDFSTEQRVVAVITSGQTRSKVIQKAQFKFQPWQPIIEALDVAGIALEDIDRIAVGLGPGSYTGIRTSISIAQGWHIARGTPCHGFCSMIVMRPTEGGDVANVSDHLLVYAQRGEYFHLSMESAIALDWDSAMKIRILPHEDVMEMSANGGQNIYGPGLKDKIPMAHDAYPDASLFAGAVEAGKGEYSPDRLAPIYIREVSFVKAGPLRDLSGVQI